MPGSGPSGPFSGQAKAQRSGRRPDLHGFKVSPIRKGQDWGVAGALPSSGVVVRSDLEARHVLEAARTAGRTFPVLGLLGGDLARTLGAQGNEQRLRSSEAMSFSLDLGEMVIDGLEPRLFVAHVVARTRTWRRVFCACNAQFFGAWNIAPRGHPNDGLLDCFDCRLRFTDVLKIRPRLAAGSHLPHPSIKELRVAEMHVEFDQPLPVWIDGEHVAAGRSLTLRVEPDALRVVV